MMIPIDKMSTTDKVIESIRSYIQATAEILAKSCPRKMNWASSSASAVRPSARRCACCRRWVM